MDLKIRLEPAGRRCRDASPPPVTVEAISAMACILSERTDWFSQAGGTAKVVPFVPATGMKGFLRLI